MSMGDATTVFIIDDDAGVREAIVDLVRSVGLQAESFSNAQDFLTSQRREGPSCLVLDVRLPGISGLELQHELRKVGVKIPIIFITGHADIPMTVKAMKSGAVEFLTKPFRDQDLLDVIQRALERDRALRDRQKQLAELKESKGPKPNSDKSRASVQSHRGGAMNAEKDTGAIFQRTKPLPQKGTKEHKSRYFRAAQQRPPYQQKRFNPELR